jgi:hypothetical protein
VVKRFKVFGIEWLHGGGRNARRTRPQIYLFGAPKSLPSGSGEVCQ